MRGSFLVPIVFLACNNQPPHTSAPAAKVVVPPPTQHAVARCTPPPDHQTAQSVEDARQQIEARLGQHASEIEEAFALGDCAAIVLKRKLVEDPATYRPARPPELLTEVRHPLHRYPGFEDRGWSAVNHSRLEEFNRRFAALGCWLDDCEDFQRVLIRRSKGVVRIAGQIQDGKSNRCFRFHNRIGDKLLTVKARVMSNTDTGQGTLGLQITTPTAEGGPGGTHIDWVTFEPQDVTAVKVVRTIGVLDTRETWGRGAQPFTLEVVPILRPQ